MLPGFAMHSPDVLASLILSGNRVLHSEAMKFAYMKLVVQLSSVLLPSLDGLGEDAPPLVSAEPSPGILASIQR